MRPITEVAAGIGLTPDDYEPYGRNIVRLDPGLARRGERRAKYIAVTGVTPTAKGEGKTVTTIGLSMALNALGHRSVAAIRQPSVGPIFGVKGGATGGGQASLYPAEDVNLHFTGDFHAVGLAHNLLAAMVDNHINHGNDLAIDANQVPWPRVVDMNDRALREIVLGLGGRANGYPREGRFDIIAASEVMAILALSTDIHDLRARLARIVPAFTRSGTAITAEALGAAGAMTVLMRKTLAPNLVQSLDGSPVLVHAGPFGNIAHGNSSVIADQAAVRLADFVCTESGFGTEMGFEKLMHIKRPVTGLDPDAVVLVASVRAAYEHGDGLERGLANLRRHVANVLAFGCRPVVALNRFPGDSDDDLRALREAAVEAGADEACVSSVFADGADGGLELARAVAAAADRPSAPKPLYDASQPAVTKIETVARTLYGAEGVELLPTAARRLREYEALGYASLPVCMAKTPLSLSHDPSLKGAPSGFVVPIRDIRLSAGAGFLYALVGEVMTMPGLPARPAALNIDIDDAGNPVGLA